MLESSTLEIRASDVMCELARPLGSKNQLGTVQVRITYPVNAEWGLPSETCNEHILRD